MAFLDRFFIRLSSRRVGEDTIGNTYWESKRALRDGRPRRFVIYAGIAEASVVPPPWWGWLHHTTALPLPEAMAYAWQKPHVQNQTGGPGAYRPQGSDLRLGVPVSPAGAYQAWTPGS
ncbi:MAG: putative dehydrogenase [Rhodospirillales bacterium]|jgi:NADH:ubiquinone oxidoreductase subunit|nr:putative dehydrogenase [Rhodospirillales bacterium]MDB5381135.1 putative dehydrogenase [Rhodospirillales bacterium]